MNENDTVEVVETQNNDTVEVETTPEVKETPKETPESKVARLKRQLKRAQQELGVAEEEVQKPIAKPFSLDRADKAFLNANGIKGPDEYELVADFVRNTGKDIEDVIESKYFISQLNDVRSMRESKIASDAASGSPRSGQTARDTVEYWVAKGQLPPAHMKQLRREVVNTRMKIDSDQGTFTDHPVIGG